MPRVVIPEPLINLYEDGFDGHDKLSRKDTGEKLSELVDRIENPLVIALDGAWGSGKSLFLKCWVGEHLKRETTTQTVYFDAFKHDYLGDPLVALTGEIADRFQTNEDKQNEQYKERMQKLKRTAWIASKSALRIGISAAIPGIVEVFNGLHGEAINAVGQEVKEYLTTEPGEKKSDSFWAGHYARIEAMKEFRDTLKDLTKPEDEKTNRLVVVVDELDRCRPDYALSLLEITKHFFNVDGVHFILGVNLHELKNSVHARYGAGVNAEVYLQKFYSIALKLPQRIERTNNSDYLHYFEYASRHLSLDDELRFLAINYLKCYTWETPMTPRAVQRILTLLALVPVNKLLGGGGGVGGAVLAPAAIAKVCAPPIYEKMKKNELNMEELKSIFNLTDNREIDFWKKVLNVRTIEIPQTRLDYNNLQYSDLLPHVCEEFLETFDPTTLEIG